MRFAKLYILRQPSTGLLVLLECLRGLAVAAGVDLRPVSAAERGQSRYERYAIVHPHTKAQIAPHTDLWSRPLLNREWTPRAVYAGLERLPLLVTGRYGAGRVVMVATTAAAVGESPEAAVFWRDVLRWLTARDAAAGPSGSRATLALRFPTPGRASLRCLGSGAAQLVVRMTDQDGAMLADGAGELSRPVTLTPGRTTAIDLPLPTQGVLGLETRESERRIWVRVGLLSADGSAMLAEQRTLSPAAPLRVRVSTGSLAVQGTAFPGPSPVTLQSFSFRMGLPVNAYAALPGTRLEGTVSLSLQCENLALEGVWKDLADPSNGSVIALNDRGGTSRRGPIDGIQGWGMWTGHSGADGALELSLPFGARLSAVTLVGDRGPVGGGFEQHNPGQVVVEVDGEQVARVDELDSLFVSGLGQARIALPPGSAGQRVTIRLPWVPPHNGHGRAEPWLAEILVDGWPADAPVAAPVTGQLTVDLVPTLGGPHLSLLSTSATIRPGELTAHSVAIPLPAAVGVGVYRLEAVFHPTGARAAVTTSAPLLVIAPHRTLQDLLELTGPTVFGTSMNVTNGFTRFNLLGTGTTEPWNGWAHPDDLVWAYERQLKEVLPNAHTTISRLYATETDMRHYSMPWREFGNGEMFFPAALPGLIANLQQQRGWAKAPVVRLTFGDRWVVGPDLNTCNGWQEFVAFDSHLRQTSGQGLAGRTRAEVYAEIHTSNETAWQAWQLERYLGNVRAIRETFRAQGKDVFIYSQDLPAVAGAAGRELSQSIRGMNDDYTWGMQDNSPTLTTGRNLGELAFNPVWQISTLMAWGFASPIFNNWQWHDPVSTIEPVRRLIYNRTWRGMLWDDGHYGGLATYGYTDNVGNTYGMAAEEYQEWWNMQQRGNLLLPESPLGAGLVISTQKTADPRTVRWNCNNALSLAEPRLLMQAFRSLSEAGLSVPFAANAAQLGRWTPPPGAALIVLNLPDWSDEEIAGLARLQAQGVPVAAFAMRSALSAAAARIFAQPSTLLLERSADGLSPAEAVVVARQLADVLNLALQFSNGLNGYGFRSGDAIMIVLEDWQEQARVGSVRLRKSSNMRRAAATNLNDHSTLVVSSAGAFWEIAVPIRSGDGVMIAVKEF